MQNWSRDGVRQERTQWRDQEISQRHRDWGFNCPAVDLDFLMVEYNKGLPVGVVEYKHNRARMPELKHATYRALKALADGYRHGPLPFMVVFYWPGIWAFKIYPVNDISKQWFSQGEMVTEYEYVRRLYRIRRFALSDDLKSRLNDELPSDEAA